MEDLHVAGVFSDAEAPLLNRLIRNEVFEILVARNRAWKQSDDACSDFVAAALTAAELEGDHYATAVRAAIRIAVFQFSAATGLPPAQRRALTDAAEEGALRYAVEPLLNFRDPEARAQLEYLARLVPTYWEPPELGARFPDVKSLGPARSNT